MYEMLCGTYCLIDCVDQASPVIDAGPLTPQPRYIRPRNISVKIGSPAYTVDGISLAINCSTVCGALPITIRWFHNGVLDSLWMNASSIEIQKVGLNMSSDNYTCRAENDLGYDEHTTTIYVFGKKPMTAVNGQL